MYRMVIDCGEGGGGGEGYKMRNSQVRNLLCPPPSRQGKTCCPPPPSFKGVELFLASPPPTFSMADVITTLKLVVPPFL